MATENTKALDRINENTEGRADQVEDGEGRLVRLLYEGCIDLFQQLLEESSKSSCPLSEKERRHLKEDLGRLFLWGDGYGDKMLDRILEQSLDLRNTVLGFISGIGKVLTGRLLTMLCRPQQGGKISKQASNLNILIEKAESMIVEASYIRDNDSDQDSDSDASDYSISDILEDISSYINCLMELVPSMERTFSQVLSKSQEKQQLPTPSFQVSESARTYVQNIFDKFPRADVKLIERLGEANWKRHTSLQLQTEDVSNYTKADPDEDPANLRPYYGVHASGFKNESTHAAAARDAYISLSNENRQYKSRTFSSNLYEVVTKESLQCKICGEIMKGNRKRIAFRHHVLLHMQPYICTFPTCEDELKTFSARQDWADHELSKHRVKKVWRCPECGETFDQAEVWRKHVGSCHKLFFSAAHLQMLAASAERYKYVPGLSMDTQCPICLVLVGASLETFTTHVGMHMEDIALTVVPSEMDSDNGSKNNFSEKDTVKACPETGTEGITHQVEMASDPGTIDPVESNQQGGSRLGKERLIHSDPPEPSELESHPTSILSTDMVKSQAKHQQESDLLPPPRVMYQEDPQDPDRGGSRQHLRYNQPPPWWPIAIACLNCRRLHIRCIGSETPEDGLCANCRRLHIECSLRPVPSQAKAFAPEHTTKPHNRDTWVSTEEYLKMAFPGAQISCSVFLLQTQQPSRLYKKLPDTTIMQSAATTFRCMDHQSQFRDFQFLYIIFRCGKTERAYLVNRDDSQWLPLINRTIEESMRAQLRSRKDNKIQVELFIEPAGTYNSSLAFRAEENEEQPEPPSISEMAQLKWGALSDSHSRKIKAPESPIKSLKSDSYSSLPLDESVNYT